MAEYRAPLRDRLRWTFGGKTGFSGGPIARARLFWNAVVCGYSSEMCDWCGRRVDIVWWCRDDDLWVRIHGRRGGVLCASCFSEAAFERGEPIRFETVAL